MKKTIAGFSDETRRQQILNYFMLGGIVCISLLTAINVTLWIWTPDPLQAGYVVSDLVAVALLLSLWRVNRVRYRPWVAWLVLGLIVLLAPVGAARHDLDRILVIYLLPVALSSFVLAPAAAWALAALAVASYSAYYVLEGMTLSYNYVFVLVVVGIALMAWRGARRVESALAEARQAQAEHEQRLRAEHEQRLFAETMREVGAALVSSLDLDAVLQRLMEQVSRILPNDMVNVMQIEGDVIHVTHWRGYDLFSQPDFLQTLHWPVAAMPTLRRMRETGDVVILSDTYADPLWVRSPETDRTRSYAGVPIRMGADVIGFLNLNSVTPGYFLPEYADRLRAYAALAAVALQNARLYTQAQQSAAEVGQLNATLEQRVADRTAELSARTAQLSAANLELKRLNRVRDEFLANMSHELRTPLTAILGLTEALQMGIYGPLADKQTGALHSVYESGQHLLQLINDMLDLSKIDVGKLKLEPGLVDVGEVCQASLRLIRDAAQKKHLRVSASLDIGAAVLVADERRLKQMLVNLLNNAVKFTPAEGSLGLEVRGDAAHDQIHFTVWDTGIGIAPEDAGRLFQPFVQVDSSLSRPYEGAGLGLMLVRRMAEMHGGSVTLTSAGVPGQGARFTLSLPWPAATRALQPVSEEVPRLSLAANLDAEAADLGSGAAAPLVLLADDDANNLIILADFLRAQLCRVKIAHDGVEAVALALACRPQLILMDIQMPKLDGLEAIRQLRANPDLAETPIVALTALVMPGDRERCLAAGATAYMSKPVRLGDLTNKLQKWLAR